MLKRGLMRVNVGSEKQFCKPDFFVIQKVLDLEVDLLGCESWLWVEAGTGCLISPVLFALW